jgi:hypothetical protein
MAAMFTELLPQLIMRYLGKISYIEDRAFRGQRGLGLAVLPQGSRIESVLGCVIPGPPVVS